jgi:hypothetical protein
VVELGPNSIDAEKIAYWRPYYLLGFGLRIKSQNRKKITGTGNRESKRAWMKNK